jgi:hypothetical protein
MIDARYIAAIGISLLIVVVTAQAGPEVRGIVVQAHHARVYSSEVTSGTTVFDGDQFSTEEDGALRLRSDGVLFDLLAGSRVVVRGQVESSKDTQATLLAGGMVFFTTSASAMEIQVEGVTIGPAADRPTTGEVRRIGAKELRVYARRGDLRLTYRKETEVIAQGKNCRVLLDPADDSLKPGEPPRKSGRRRKAFLLIPILAGGVILGRIISDHGAMESPDRP